MKKYGEIENFGEEIAKMFSDLEIKIMEKMVDLIKENGFSGASSDYLMNRLRSLGVAEEDVAKYFEEALKGTEIKLEKIFDDEVYKEYYGHYRDFQAVGFDQIPYKDNIELQQLVSGIHDQTFEKIGGMSASLGFVLRQPNGQLIATPLQTFYQSQLDQAILEISSGAFSYEQVLERVINKMTSSGVRIINFESGAHRGMVSHVRTAILTGFRQIQGRINEQTAQELGTEYFEISYHVGARPAHQVWQGRVYSKEELVTKCGLGSVTGLCGANCYHTYRPFIPGVSVRTYSDDELKAMIAEENKKKLYNGKEYTTYEALQQQRYLERTARKYRQDIRLLEKGLEDADDAAKEILILKQARYQNTLSRYKDFTKKMGLPTQNERIFNDGLGRIKVPEKTIAKRTEAFTALDGTTRVRIKIDESKLSDYGYFKNQINDNANINKNDGTVLKRRFSYGKKDAKAVYRKYVPENSVIDYAYIDIPCYNEKEKKIYLNLSMDAQNERGAFATWFHEHGHLIDDYAGHISDDPEFLSLLQEDALTYRKNYGHKHNLKTFDKVDKAISEELNDMRIHSAVSDIFEGLTNRNISGCAGHPDDYWKYSSHITDEAFAHMFECEFDSKRYKQMKKYFPKSLKYFEGKLKELKK